MSDYRNFFQNPLSASPLSDDYVALHNPHQVTANYGTASAFGAVTAYCKGLTQVEYKILQMCETVARSLTKQQTNLPSLYWHKRLCRQMQSLEQQVSNFLYAGRPILRGCYYPKIAVDGPELKVFSVSRLPEIQSAETIVLQIEQQPSNSYVVGEEVLSIEKLRSEKGIIVKTAAKKFYFTVSKVHSIDHFLAQLQKFFMFAGLALEVGQQQGRLKLSSLVCGSKEKFQCCSLTTGIIASPGVWVQSFPGQDMQASIDGVAAQTDGQMIYANSQHKTANGVAFWLGQPVAKKRYHFRWLNFSAYQFLNQNNVTECLFMPGLYATNLGLGVQTLERFLSLQSLQLHSLQQKKDSQKVLFHVLSQIKQSKIVWQKKSDELMLKVMTAIFKEQKESVHNLQQENMEKMAAAIRFLSLKRT